MRITSIVVTLAALGCSEMPEVRQAEPQKLGPGACAPPGGEAVKLVEEAIAESKSQTGTVQLVWLWWRMQDRVCYDGSELRAMAAKPNHRLQILTAGKGELVRRAVNFYGQAYSRCGHLCWPLDQKAVAEANVEQNTIEYMDISFFVHPLDRCPSEQTMREVGVKHCCPNE